VLLAFDTATPLVSVALHDGQEVVAERLSFAAMKHGEQLAPLIEAVMREAGVDRSTLTRLAVGTGPGPFTGLRVGLVTARTLGHVLGVPVAGVCTLDVIAVEVAATAPDTDLSGGFLVATDARRKEVYAAAYDSRGRRVSGPSVGSAAEVATDRPVAGAGPALFPASFPRAIAPDRPSAGWLARAVVGELVELTGPEPLYLRRPDAVAPGAPKRVT
jgi:tRNA threonylcarbamoyladenosine biosynthesis protein TsaB